MKPLSVLQVMTARTIGGAELYVERLVAALESTCCFTIALADHPGMSELADRLAQHVPVLRFPFDRAIQLPRAVGQLRELAEGFDVIHLNSNHPGSRLGILMGFTLSGLDRPVICVEHGVSPLSAVKVPTGVAWALPALFRWSRRAVTQIVVGSEENRRRLVELYRVRADKIEVVHPGFDPVAFAVSNPPMLRQELGLTADQPLIIVVGRLAANKGQRFLVDAAPTILSRFPNTHFVFAGNPEGRADLEQRIHKLGLERHFDLIAFRSDVVSLLRSSDLFVLPSLAEGFSLSIIEALAAGLPVIATRVGGAEEVLENGRNGFLVPPADAEALGQAVLQVLSLDAAAKERLRQAAQETARRFSFDVTAQTMYQIYERLRAGSR